jgi:hypothetical protein
VEIYSPKSLGLSNCKAINKMPARECVEPPKQPLLWWGARRWQRQGAVKAKRGKGFSWCREGESNPQDPKVGGF